MFSGLVRCADCGEKLYYCTSASFETRQDHFVCSTSRKKGKEVCDTHFIRAVVLEEGTLQHMRLVIQCVADYEDAFRKALGAKRSEEAKKELSAKKRTLQKSENRLAELDRLFKRIYEDMVNRKLSEARFQMLSDDYEQEQADLRAKIEMLENEDLAPLVDQKAIVEALKTNRIRKYVTDFPNSDVASQKNAIVIPHLGASTEESEDNCAVMAVKEVRDYLENGNIHNSVNYPNCDMGVCTSAMRVAIIHRNIPNMLAKFTSAFGELGINIERLTNVTRGEYGYVMVDLSHMADDAEIEKLRAIEGVLKVRVMK